LPPIILLFVIGESNGKSRNRHLVSNRTTSTTGAVRQFDRK
jgi:hypothetical protein